MRTRLIRAAASVVVLGGLLYAGARHAGPLPPLGPLLDPVHGAWSAATHATLPREATATIPGLSGPVEIRYDQRGVPHIFARTRDDVIRGLGYVVARDRMFQLELQARAASGTLTELVGKVALPLDQRTRALGMPRAAEQAYATLDTAGSESHLLRAYADGINAYIDAMQPADWPVEYKLLGVRPSRWAPVNALHMMERMSLTLAYSPGELVRAAAAAKVGNAAAAAIFPDNSVIQEPIQPNGEHGERFDFAPLPPPGTPDTAARRLLAVASAFGIGTTGDPTHFASNNWAVAPSRTRDGLALLAGDPHLDLTLPSIWYEVHLVVPGQLDEYGVSIAGLPGVVLGFTRDVAWSFTNTGADVMDFYRETVDDTLHPTKYRVDGAWLPVEQRVEAYRDPSGKVVHVDTLRFTRRGPLSRQGRDWLSMRWTALEPSHDVQALIAGAEATSARAFLDSLAAYFFVPAQNIIAADRGGTIAIRSTGHIPLRPRGTDGMTIFDGSSSASDWTGFWPVSQYPQAFNPAQGYLASANQQPIDPRVAPAYQGDDRSFEPWRAMQINRLLRADSQVTVDDMRRFQVDPGSERAELFMPYLLGAVRHADSAGHADSTLRAAGRILAAWDMRYTQDNRGAALFEQALRNIRRDLWDELDDGTERRVALPSWDVTLEAMAQPASTWWDDRRTKTVVEDRDAIIARALHAAYDTLARRYGPPRDGGWRWDTVARVPIAHLLGLPGFSDMNLRTSGGIGTLNPAMDGGGAGPSWRMVVQLGPEIRAWATYPGGQSGNPASPWYDNRIPGWLAGQLDTLYLPRDPGGVDAHHLSASLTLAPASAASRRGGH